MEQSSFDTSFDKVTLSFLNAKQYVREGYIHDMSNRNRCNGAGRLKTEKGAKTLSRSVRSRIGHSEFVLGLPGDTFRLLQQDMVRSTDPYVSDG
jgi:hypothetical protein